MLNIVWGAGQRLLAVAVCGAGRAGGWCGDTHGRAAGLTSVVMVTPGRRPCSMLWVGGLHPAAWRWLSALAAPVVVGRGRFLSLRGGPWVPGFAGGLPLPRWYGAPRGWAQHRACPSSRVEGFSPLALPDALGLTCALGATALAALFQLRRRKRNLFLRREISGKMGLPVILSMEATPFSRTSLPRESVWSPAHP